MNKILKTGLFILTAILASCKPYQRLTCNGSLAENTHWNKNQYYEKSFLGNSSSKNAHLGDSGECSYSCNSDAILNSTNGACEKVSSLIDNPVKGMNFFTYNSSGVQTSSGVTGDAGFFNCVTGEDVKFYLGKDVFLGTAKCGGKIKITDLFTANGTTKTTAGAQQEIAVLLRAMTTPEVAANDYTKTMDISSYVDQSFGAKDFSVTHAVAADLASTNAILNAINKAPIPSPNGSTTTYSSLKTAATTWLTNTAALYAGSNSPVCTSGFYPSGNDCLPTNCIGSQVFDLVTKTCVNPVCMPGYALDAGECKIASYTPNFSTLSSCSTPNICDGKGVQTKNVLNCNVYVEGTKLVGVENDTSFCPAQAADLSVSCDSPLGDKASDIMDGATKAGTSTMSCPAGASTGPVTISCSAGYEQSGQTCIKTVATTYAPVYGNYGACSVVNACDGKGAQSKPLVSCDIFINGVPSGNTTDTSKCLAQSVPQTQSCDSPAGDKLSDILDGATKSGTLTTSCLAGASTGTQSASCLVGYNKVGLTCVKIAVTYEPIYNLYGACSVLNACDGKGTQLRTVSKCEIYNDGIASGTFDNDVTKCQSKAVALSQSCDSPAGDKISNIMNGATKLGDKTVSCLAGSSSETFKSVSCIPGVAYQSGQTCVPELVCDATFQTLDSSVVPHVCLDKDILASSVVINANTVKTKDPNISLTIAATNAQKMEIYDDVACGTGADQLAFATSKSFSLAPGDGTRSVSVKLVNGSKSVCVSDSIILDTTPPVIVDQTTQNIIGNSNAINGACSDALSNPMTIVISSRAATSEFSNASISCVGNNFTTNVTVASNGAHPYRITANDSIGNVTVVDGSFTNGCPVGQHDEAGLCVSDSRTMTCGGSGLPSNTVWNSGSLLLNDTYTQHYTSGAWEAQKFQTPGAPGVDCSYSCASNYSADLGNNSITCQLSTQRVACSGTPNLTGKTVYTDGKFTQNWSGTSYVPASKSLSFLQVSANECDYSCNSGTHSDDAGATCVANTQTVSCPALASTTSMVFNAGMSTYSKIWDGTSYNTMTNTYTSNASVACGYQCASGYSSTDGGVSCTAAAVATTNIFHGNTGKAFALLRSNGSVVTWGNYLNGGDSNYSDSSIAAAPAGSLSSGVVNLVNNGYAWAALKTDGSVVTWGVKTAGGDSMVYAYEYPSDTMLSSAVDSLKSGVVKIVASNNLLAAIKSDNSVVTWGSSGYRGSSNVSTLLSSGVSSVVDGVNNKLVALTKGDTVVSWSTVYNSTTATTNSISSTYLSSGFGIKSLSDRGELALTNSGGVINTGTPLTGWTSVSSSLTSGVVSLIRSNGTGVYSALKTDGSVYSWGFAGALGGSGLKVSSGAMSVVANNQAFAALKSDGSVSAWGDSTRGGSISSVFSSIGSAGSGVVSITAPRNGTGSAFAALKANGSVVLWGEAAGGADGIVHTYNSAKVATPTNDYSIKLLLTSGVVKLVGSTNTWAALKSDGSVVTWGVGYNGGDSSSVASSLTSGVVDVFTNGNSWAALKSDGSVVTWGDATSGGYSGNVIF